MAAALYTHELNLCHFVTSQPPFTIFLIQNDTHGLNSEITCLNNWSSSKLQCLKNLPDKIPDYKSQNKSVLTDCNNSICIFEAAWALWFQQQCFYIWIAVSHIHQHFIIDQLLKSGLFESSLDHYTKKPSFQVGQKMHWPKAQCPIMFKAFCPMNIDLALLH